MAAYWAAALDRPVAGLVEGPDQDLTIALIRNSPPWHPDLTVTRMGLRGAPNGIRTRVAALKGRCPRPLDDGGSDGAPS